MTPAVIRWRRQGADDRRFARMLAASLVIHGVLAWLLLYHLEQFSPTHLPSAYLVELLTPAVIVPEPQHVADAVPLLPAAEPVLPQLKAPPSAPPPMPDPPEPSPQQIPVAPPPPTVTTQKSQPELTPPQSLPRKVPPPSAPPPPQLSESAVSRTAASRNVELAPPTLTRQPVRRPENVTALPESQSLPVARRSQDVGDDVRAAPHYQPSRQPSTETLPEQSGGLPPTTANQGDIAVPDRRPARTVSRSPRTEPALPADNGQQLAVRQNTTVVASPRGPTSAPTKLSSAGNNETLSVPSPSSFATPAVKDAAIPLPGATGPATGTRPAAVGAGPQLPADQTPRLQAASPQARLDQTTLAAFRSLKTCLDTEQESRLKTRLAVLLEGDATCSSGGSRYFFAATETAYSLQVGIAMGGQVFKDRCDALQQAVRCVEQSRK